MNLLIDNSLLKYGKVFAYCNIKTAVYDISRQNSFYTFDVFNPTHFIGNINNVPKSLIKVLKEQPNIRVGFFHTDRIDENFYNLVNETIPPDFIFTNDADKFSNYKTVQLNQTGDAILYYKGQKIQSIESDVVIIENVFNSKPPELLGLKYRIFSNNLVQSINYCGTLEEASKKNFYASSRLSLCSEENMINCVLSGGNPIPIDSPIDDIYKYLKNPPSVNRKEIIENKTSFNTAIEILEQFQASEEVNIVKDKKKEFFQ